MYSLCPFGRVTPRCEFKVKGECHKYVDEAIPIGHLGGHIMPASFYKAGGEGLAGVPMLGVGCCEYIMLRDAQAGRSHKQRIGVLTVHDIPSALEQMK